MFNCTQQPRRVPIPSLEGCGPKSQTLNSPQQGRTHTCPSPFQRDVGQLILSQWRNGRGRNMRGDPRNGRPIKCVPTMNHNENCGLFFLFFIPCIKLTISLPNNFSEVLKSTLVTSMDLTRATKTWWRWHGSMGIQIPKTVTHTWRRWHMVEDSNTCLKMATDGDTYLKTMTWIDGNTNQWQHGFDEGDTYSKRATQGFPPLELPQCQHMELQWQRGKSIQTQWQWFEPHNSK